jgi:hypothetical protein
MITANIIRTYIRGLPPAPDHEADNQH